MNENQEVKETSIDATLASDEAEEETKEQEPELNSSPVPTEEQVKESGLEQESEVSDAPTATESAEQNVASEMTEEQKAVEKMLSQSQVDEIVGRTRTETRDKTLKGIFDHYEVADEAGLDNLFAKSQAYDTLKDETDSVIGQMKSELEEVKSKVAMYESNIAPERYEDVKLILKGKGKDITAENILSEIETHPEWKKADPIPETADNPDVAGDGNFVKVESKPESSIEVLGNDRPEAQSGPSEWDIAKSLYGLK